MTMTSAEELRILNDIYGIQISYLLLLGFHESCHSAVAFFLKWKSEMSGHLYSATNLSDYIDFPIQLKQL